LDKLAIPPTAVIAGPGTTTTEKAYLQWIFAKINEEPLINIHKKAINKCLYRAYSHKAINNSHDIQMLLVKTWALTITSHFFTKTF
jgi:hypothetical protein